MARGKGNRRKYKVLRETLDAPQDKPEWLNQAIGLAKQSKICCEKFVRILLRIFKEHKLSIHRFESRITQHWNTATA